MNLVARSLAIAAIVLLALALAAGVLVRRLIDPEAVRAAIEQQAAVALGQPVRVGAAELALSARPRMVLSDMQVGSPAAITLRRVEVVMGLGALLSRHVEQAGVAVSGGRIILPLPFALGAGRDGERDAGTAADRGATALAVVSIDRLSVEEIELVVGDRRVRLDAESSVAGDRLAFSRVLLRSGQETIEGRGELSSLSARRGTFSATADSLDLDELLTIASGFSGAGPGHEQAAARDSTGRARPMDVRVELTTSRGRLLGIEFASLATTLALTRAGITLDPLGLRVLDGALTGRVRVDTASQPAKASISATVARIDVARLAALTGSSGVMSGRLDGHIELHADAGAPDVVFRTAGGRATVVVSNGRMPGLDLVGPVISAFGKPKAPVQRSDAFSRLSGTFSLSRGVLHSDNLAMTSRDVDLEGRGTLRVAGATVDVTADLVLSETLSSQAGRDLYRYARQGSRIVLPATIRGKLESPSVSIDLAAALRRAARNALEERLKKELGRLLKR